MRNKTLKNASEAELIGEMLKRQFEKLGEQIAECPSKPEYLKMTDEEWKQGWENQPIALLKIVVMPEKQDIRYSINPKNALIDLRLMDGSKFAGNLIDSDRMVMRDLRKLYFQI